MGNLPYSRTLTINPTDPIPSALLNELEDQIIGAKIPELPRHLGSQKWSLVTGGTATFDGPNDQWSFGAVSQLVCALDLDQVTRITSVTWVYNRANLGNVTLKLRRRDTTVARAAAADVASIVDNATNGWQNNVQVYNHIVAAGFSYFLQLQCDNAAHLFGGALLKRDRG